MKRIITFLILFLALAACEKPLEHPETTDPIYNDLLAEVSAAESAATKTEKELEDFKKEAEKVAPQTGQIKFAEKRVYETQAKLDKIKQMVEYWKIRAESRKHWARKKYLAAYKKKEHWPDPKEYEEYQLQRKLEQAPKEWNLKRRLEESRAGVALDGPKKAGGGEHGGGGEPGGGGEHAEAEEKPESGGEHH